MRSLLIAIAGLTVALLAVGAGIAIGALPGAALIMTGAFLGPITLGIAIARATNPRGVPITRRRPRFRRRSVPPLADPSAWRSRCGDCGARKQLLNSIWVCAHCDIGSAISRTG